MRCLEFNMFPPLHIRDVQVTSCLRATLALSYVSLLRQMEKKKEKLCPWTWNEDPAPSDFFFLNSTIFSRKAEIIYNLYFPNGLILLCIQMLILP